MYLALPVQGRGAGAFAGWWLNCLPCWRLVSPVIANKRPANLLNLKNKNKNHQAHPAVAPSTNNSLPNTYQHAMHTGLQASSLWLLLLLLFLLSSSFSFHAPGSQACRHCLAGSSSLRGRFPRESRTPKRTPPYLVAPEKGSEPRGRGLPQSRHVSYRPLHKEHGHARSSRHHHSPQHGTKAGTSIVCYLPRSTRTRPPHITPAPFVAKYIHTYIRLAPFITAQFFFCKTPQLLANTKHGSIAGLQPSTFGGGVLTSASGTRAAQSAWVVGAAAATPAPKEKEGTEHGAWNETTPRRNQPVKDARW